MAGSIDSFASGMHGPDTAHSGPAWRSRSDDSPSTLSGVMTDHGEAFQRVTVAEAAHRLGVSVATVRRRIRAGELVAERLIRPQGSAFVVRLPVDASASVSDAYDTEQEPRVTARTQASAPEAMAALIQATLTPIIAPLVAQLDAHRQTVERQADALRELERENGRLAAELAAAHAQNTLLDAPGSTERSDPTTEPLSPFPEPQARTWNEVQPWWRRLLSAVYG
jgi:excisionase family DNA binding protein